LDIKQDFLFVAPKRSEGGCSTTNFSGRDKILAMAELKLDCYNQRNCVSLFAATATDHRSSAIGKAMMPFDI
jgi:hypothetical protein